MTDERVFIIKRDGCVECLYHDMLSKIDGDVQVERASEVEYDNEEKAWKIKFLGDFTPLNEKIFSVQFPTRGLALAAEVKLINEFMIERTMQNGGQADCG